MRCYRIATKKYAQKLSGEGARLYGGRWNSEGHSVIYAAQTSSLAMLEILVHLNASRVGNNFCMMIIEVPDKLVAKAILQSDLPLHWNKNPHEYFTQRLGDDFILKGEKVAIAVPSAVNTLEHNYLINDRHPDFSKVKVIDTIPLDFDRRLVGTS